MMSDCQHKQIVTWRSTDGEPVRLWSCTECDIKFVPITNELRLEHDLAAAVERAERAEADLDMLTKGMRAIRIRTECMAYHMGFDIQTIADAALAALAAKETPDA